MKEFAAERIPVSSILGTKGDEHLLMFYFILAFNDAVYYIEEKQLIVIFKQENHVLHIFDVISKTRVGLERFLADIVSVETETKNFYFTPDFDVEDIYTELITERNDQLFVRPLIKI